MPQTDRSYEDRLTDLLADDIVSTSDAIAMDRGAPPDTVSPSDREKVRLWNRIDPAVDHARLLEMLQTTGVPPEVMQTLQIGRFAKSHPQLVQAYSQPTQDPTLADRLARLAAAPFRIPLWDSLDPKDRVREAQRIARLADRQGEMEATA